MHPQRRLAPLRLAPVAAALALLTIPDLAHAENPEISARRAAQRRTFTDAEIAAGFYKLAFGAEFHRAGPVDRIRKFDGPVRVYIDNRARPDRSGILAAIIDDIGAGIAHLDLARTARRKEANVIVTLVRDRDLSRTVARIYGRDQARRIMRELDPQCLSGFRKDSGFRITHAEVVLVADVDDFVFRDCAYEELLQALGPINDDASVPWTMFNDDVQMGFFDLYDRYILNLLYDPRIRPGMTRREVRALLPAVLASVRRGLGRQSPPGTAAPAGR
jgi:hypothetical protein